MSENLEDFAKASLPQDPFLPEKPLLGPAFLDTEACLCVLRGTPDQSVNEPLWQCVGDQRSTYNTRLGKWFRPQGSGANIKGAVDDASNPPDTSKPLQWEGTNGALIPLPSNGSLSGTDGFCTGVNNTDFSKRIYESEEQLQSKQYPTSGAPCLRPGAVPIQIQTLQSWNQDGCSPGFLCESMVSCLLYPQLTSCQARATRSTRSRSSAHLLMSVK